MGFDGIEFVAGFFHSSGLDGKEFVAGGIGGKIMPV